MMNGNRFKKFALSLCAMATMTSMGYCQAPEEPCTDYPDFGYAPETFKEPFFKLSQTYPKQLPGESAIPAFFKNSMSKEDWQKYYKTQWRDYLMGVRDYCYEGNTVNGWRLEDNPVRMWYHMPWQHWGRYGREGVHGLTKEAPIRSKQLAITQTTHGQTYAVAMYNDIAGYLIGQVWRDPDMPNVAAIEANHGFAHGAVVCKLLFADIPLEQVPYLTNPLSWNAYITQSFGSDDRVIREVHLIQMDIMVKDDRSEFGWLFGTFQYNGALNHPNKWDNLIPVGLQWGNDPTVKDDDFTNQQPKETRINPKIKESVINPDTKELPPTHLGWNGRLNGPVDNPRSSCMSCHMVAQHPYDGNRIAPMFLKNETIETGSEKWMLWHRNLACMTPFDEGTVATDSSLQMAMSLQNFFEWKNDRGGRWVHKPPMVCHPDHKAAQSRTKN